MSNYKLNFREICQKFLIYTLKEHLHEICERKFGRVNRNYMYVNVIY